MFGEKNNLKDTSHGSTSGVLGIVIKDTPPTLSYTKTTKLITALYMVTDIMDKDEPLRNKLRTLGVQIVSDTYATAYNALPKISEIMSFLDIAGAMSIVSTMNSSILKKEFQELAESIQESMQDSKPINTEINLSDFFKNDLPEASKTLPSNKYKSINAPVLNRIGVQRGSTLLQALSDKGLARTLAMSDTKNASKSHENFDVLKKQRRADIVSFVNSNGGSATITDIRSKAPGSLASCGEKTLQRELLSMLKDGVLKKTGEKRWSRYFVS